MTALINAIDFEIVSEDPSPLARRVTFSLTDGDGGTSNLVNQTVNIQANPDPPVLTGGSTKNYQLGAQPECSYSATQF